MHMLSIQLAHHALTGRGFLSLVCLTPAADTMYLPRPAQDKWSQPGWRIEKKYTNKVLLGNWAEERLQFNREPKIANSTSRADYQPHWDIKSDAFERRCGLQRAEGLPAKLLFAQQGSPSSHCLVTHYEESYGRKQTNALPTLQPSHQKILTWQLQKSDRPSSAFPNYSGSQRLQKHYLDKESHVPLLTVYRSAYQQHPLSAFCQGRFARASHRTSTHLHKANHHNKDLDLRQRPLRQVPDQCLRLLQPSQHA